MRFFYQILSYCLLATSMPSCSVKAPVSTKRLTDRFIEIEADRSNVWLGCFEINPEEHLSLMNFYVKDSVTIHEFFYRRLLPTKDCESQLKDYQKLLKRTQRVTVVGITPEYEVKEIDGKIEGVPEEFSRGLDKIANWTFIRLQTVWGCEAYFPEHCDPEKYWGGLTPPPEPY